MKKLFQKLVMKPIQSVSENTNRVPIYGAILALVVYFFFEYRLTNPLDTISLSEQVLVAGLSLLIFFTIYTYPKLSGENRRSELISFIALSVLTMVVTIGYDGVISRLFPAIYRRYKTSNVIIILLVAPMLEELVYRYLLFDKWAKPKYGPIKSILLVSFLFIITHPITGISGFALYWLPTLLFFSVYDLGGIYLSILVHMIFNLIAIL